MSKIGRKPIPLGNTTVNVDGNEVTYKGKLASGSHMLPAELRAEIVDKTLVVKPASDARAKVQRVNALWGLHRALLANKIKGADEGFSKQLKIVGLGYKAIVQGDKVNLSLGFSHKIDVPLPKEVQLTVDKSGQLLTFTSADKEALGKICSRIRDLRKPEPYKGTGIWYVGEEIRRKAGKAKV